jgi:thiamine-phosphate pyrophosphorylase
LLEMRALDPKRVFRMWIDAGVRLIQLRAKRLPGGPLLTLAAEFAAEARAAGATFILNDRADLARLAGAAGVHVGQTDLHPVDARNLIGPDAVIGLSTHSAGEFSRALDEPVDYVAVGAVFPTSIKGPMHPTVGLAFVHDAANRAAERRLPIVAIGGITLDTAPRVIEAGASAVAVITDLIAQDVAARARAYLAVLG